MATLPLIDAQFDRAVEIVQSLPKTGPIQTGYEEKLAMYSLYKQATVGNVKPPRPGIWDVLGRAKYDAWAAQKDLEPQQARWLYVQTLQKVLRKYSDKTVARDLVRELDAYEADPSSLVMSGSLTRSAGSASSGSASPPLVHIPQPLPVHMHERYDANGALEESTDDDDEGETDEDGEIVAPLEASVPRPHSSLSSQMRYRTPAANSVGLPAILSARNTPITNNIPLAQPMPRYTTPSVFAASSSPLPSTSYGPNPSQISGMMSPPQTSSGPTYYRGPAGSRNYQPNYGGASPMTGPIPVRPPLERAVESVQASLAALHERLEVLESMSGYPNRSITSAGTDPSRRWTGVGSSGSRPPARPGRGPLDWEPSNMGLWSIILQPLSRFIASAQELIRMLANNPDHSPVLLIIRRLFLDASFVLFLLAVIRLLWRRSGLRRREVKLALVGLWRAIIGGKPPPRMMVERGV